MASTMVTAKLPEPMYSEARKRWPDFTGTQLIRYSIALALWGDESKALAATRDPRIKRPPAETEPTG